MAISEPEVENVDLLSLLPLIYCLVMTGSKAREHDITRMQMILLLALSRRERLLMSRVAEYMSSSREQATRSVDHLVRDGYVERLADETNRTHVFIHLTSRGREFLDRFHRDFEARIHLMAADKLSSGEIESLTGHVTEVIRLLDKVV